MLEQCIAFMRIFTEKHEAGEILFQGKAGCTNVLAFLKHGDKRKCQVMMASHSEMQIEGHQTLEGDTNLDRMAQQV